MQVVALQPVNQRTKVNVKESFTATNLQIKVNWSQNLSSFSDMLDPYCKWYISGKATICLAAGQTWHHKKANIVQVMKITFAFYVQNYEIVIEEVV